MIGTLLLLSALALPALNSISGASSLNSATRQVSNMMTLARSEAITSRSSVQLRIVTDKWNATAENYDAHFRKMSLWKYDRNAGVYVQSSKWETLPMGIVVYPGLDPWEDFAFPPGDDPGTYFLSMGEASAQQNVVANGAAINTASIEFLPNGSIQTGPTQASRVYILLVKGSIPAGQTAFGRDSTTGKNNWAQIRVSQKTGRISIVRP